MSLVAAADATTRVEDYLSDKVQTTADLESVSNLLMKVREQQELLKKQLQDAKSDHNDAEREASDHAQALLQRVRNFQNDQADIDRRLRALTQSDVSDEAVKIFESRMTKLRRLEIAEGYVKILREADSLASSARKTIKSNPSSALASHARMQVLLHDLKAAQPAAEGAAPHLVDLIENESTSLYGELKKSLEDDLQKTLEKMAWPKKELKLPASIVENWRDQVKSLLHLQEPGLKVNISDSSISSLSEPVNLLPLQVMVRPLALRFQYHFYGDRPTNRLDKPEYFFSHVLDQIEQHSPYMTQLLQPLLDERIKESQDLEMIYPDSISAFITSLLPTVSAKCLSLLPNITNQPQLLSHFIHEMMAFDSTLRDSWAYTPVAGSYLEWKGLTWEMLTTHGYFETWLAVEKEFALTRYRKIRDSVESASIEFDGVEQGRSKPTKGAIRVNDLLETITDRYRGLISFSQKMKFLMDVQLAIFDDYHNHLHGALQAFLVSSHTAGRLIQGQTDNEATGLRGLETLSKIFGSAEYLERKMSDWSEDIFFIELWEELQDRASRNTRGGSVGRGLTVEDVAARTSASIKQEDGMDDEGGALFDETAASYRKLRERSETEIVRILDLNIRNAARPLTKAPIWSSLSSTASDVASLATSSALDSLLSTLATLLEYLAKVMAPAPLRRINRQICLTIQKELLDNLIMRHSFSTAGAAQLKRDVLAIEDIIDRNVNMIDEASRNMQKLEESLVLLNLPVKASTRRVETLSVEHDSDTAADDDDWGFTADNDDADDTNQTQNAGHNIDNEEDPEERESPWGLWEAEKAIFANNESARRALTDMKLELISEGEARELIRRRVEINA